MSKTIKVTYGVSIMMGEHWQKIDVEQLPDEGETMETVLDEVSERVKSWHKSKYPNMYGEKQKSQFAASMGIEMYGNYNGTFPDDNKEWEEIKIKLAEIEFKEDAQAFINTTNYAMTIEAKKIINSKPVKK